MIGRQGRKKIYPECMLHGLKVFRWFNGEPTAATPRYKSRGRRDQAQANTNSRGTQRTETKSKLEPEFGSKEDGEFEHESGYEATPEPVNRRSPLHTTLAMQEVEGNFYSNEIETLPPVSRQFGDDSPPEQAIALTETGQEFRSAVALAPCYSTRSPRSALEEALANIPPLKEPSIQEKIDQWLQFGELTSLFPIGGIQSPKEHTNSWEMRHQSPQPAALPASCVGLKRVLEETDVP